MEIDLPSARRLPLAVAAPRATRASLPSRRKKRRKNRGGDITPIRLLRRLRRQPRRDRQGPPGHPRPGPAAAPEARSSCRKELRMMRGRCGRTSFGPGASMARLGRKSCVGMAVRFAVGAKGSQNQKPPPGPPRPPPIHCLPAPDCPEFPGSFLLLACSRLRGIARLKILPLSKCPRTVSRSRWASRRAPFAAAPVALRAASAAANAR